MKHERRETGAAPNAKNNNPEKCGGEREKNPQNRKEEKAPGDTEPTGQQHRSEEERELQDAQATTQGVDKPGNKTFPIWGPTQKERTRNRNMFARGVRATAKTLAQRSQSYRISGNPRQPERAKETAGPGKKVGSHEGRLANQKSKRPEGRQVVQQKRSEQKTTTPSLQGNEKDPERRKNRWDAEERTEQIIPDPRRRRGARRKKRRECSQVTSRQGKEPGAKINDSSRSPRHLKGRKEIQPRQSQKTPVVEERASRRCSDSSRNAKK
mmetsp:Transcript_42512/g.131275  ORF Transcript_42512/g.131275 Transcript_42512/m.131275 type:complete len:268 (-) Transcript_42512:265-1068(-)